MTDASEEPQQDEELPIEKEFNQIQDTYENDPKQSTFNLLLLGELGSGKTHLLKTARKPVHIDSFDHGGTKTVRQEIEKGTIFADTRWEDDNPQDPFVFRKWVEEYNRRNKIDYYESLGTYCIDSLTEWQSALMNHILAKEGIAGQSPRFTKDYQPHKTKTKNFLTRILSLPCDVIITGHLKAHEDEVSGRTTYRLMATGSNKTEIPTMFDEVWVMEPKQQGGTVNYRVLTKSTGRHLARSRLASNGKIETYEEPDIKAILRKAGLETRDLPVPGRK